MITNREQGQLADTSPCAVDGGRIKWAWLRSLAVHDHSFVLKRGIRLTRLSSAAVWQVTYQSYLNYLKFSPHKPAMLLSCIFSGHGCIFE